MIIRRSTRLSFITKSWVWSAALLVWNTTALAEDRFFSKTYSKEDLQKTMPANPVEDLAKKVSLGATNFLKEVRDSLREGKRSQKINSFKTRAIDKQEFGIAISSLKEPSEYRTDTEGLRGFFAKESQTLAGRRLSNQFQLLKELQEGLRLDLNLATSHRANAARPAAANVKYGLQLKSITPSVDAPLRANVATVDADEWQFAKKAEVEWTIAPKTSDGDLQIQKSSSSHVKPTAEPVWKILLPEPRFRTEVVPTGIESMATSGEEPSFGYRATVAQTQGLYTYSHEQKNEEANATHAFRVPVFKQAAMGRRFDDSWQPLESSLYNVLAMDDLPSVHLHRLERDARFKAEAAYSVGAHTIKASALSPTQSEHVKDADRLERYQVEYGHSF